MPHDGRPDLAEPAIVLDDLLALTEPAVAAADALLDAAREVGADVAAEHAGVQGVGVRPVEQTHLVERALLAARCLNRGRVLGQGRVVSQSRERNLAMQSPR